MFNENTNFKETENNISVRKTKNEYHPPRIANQNPGEEQTNESFEEFEKRCELKKERILDKFGIFDEIEDKNHINNISNYDITNKDKKYIEKVCYGCGYLMMRIINLSRLMAKDPLPEKPIEEIVKPGILKFDTSMQNMFPEDLNKVINGTMKIYKDIETIYPGIKDHYKEQETFPLFNFKTYINGGDKS